MIENNDIKAIKSTIEQMLSKMIVDGFDVAINAPSQSGANLISSQSNANESGLIDLSITLQEPQYLIGQNGHTLLDLERIAKIVMHKKLQKNLPITLDINNYKKKKIDYLKFLAKDLAEEVSLNRRKKILPPMPSYQRKVIHAELAGRSDIVTKSEGEGVNRCVVIAPV